MYNRNETNWVEKKNLLLTYKIYIFIKYIYIFNIIKKI